MLARQLLRSAALRRCTSASTHALRVSLISAATSRPSAQTRLQSSLSDTLSAANSSTSAFPPFLQKSRSTSGAGDRDAPQPSQGSGGDDSGTFLTRQEKAELAAHPSDSFHSLKGYVEYDIYKALVEKPFNFEKMSTVQEAVLGLLPELVAPSARGAEKAEIPEDTVTVNEDGSPRRGYREMSTDLLVKAKTGTGKTLAFLIPALEARVQDLVQEHKRYKAANPNADKNTISRHMADYRKKTVGAVILSPTRELAAQIATEAVRATHHMKDFGVQLFIGGASKQQQLRDFSRNRRDIVVATPGRMNDLLGEGLVGPHLRKAKMLVFDEADTLLDMGFSDAIREIVSQLPPKDQRQTFMFSATMSKEVRQIARETIRDKHTFIDTVPKNEANAHLHIPQYHTILEDPSQQIMHIFRLLAHDALLHAKTGGKAIIFLPTTRWTMLFSTILYGLKSFLPFGSRGTRVFEMHSKKTQQARDRAAGDFRSSKGGYNILVTSDVSARGVDYPGVTRVIQVGIPPTSENYVHRLGRTGRAGKDGRGDIVLLPWESRYVSRQLQGMPLQPVSVDGFKDEVDKMASDFDANPVRSEGSAPSRSSDGRRSSFRDKFNGSIATPCLGRLQEAEKMLKDDVLPELDELEVNDTFASQLGFYVGHAHELNVGRSEMYSGLQKWAQAAFNLPETPTVSASMMQKLGVSAGSGSRSRGHSAENGRARAYEDYRSQRNGSDRGSGRFDRSGGRGGRGRTSRSPF